MLCVTKLFSAIILLLSSIYLSGVDIHSLRLVKLVTIFLYTHVAFPPELSLTDQDSFICGRGEG